MRLIGRDDGRVRGLLVGHPSNGLAGGFVNYLDTGLYGLEVVAIVGTVALTMFVAEFIAVFLAAMAGQARR